MRFDFSTVDSRFVVVFLLCLTIGFLYSFHADICPANSDSARTYKPTQIAPTMANGIDRILNNEYDESENVSPGCFLYFFGIHHALNLHRGEVTTD